VVTENRPVEDGSETATGISIAIVPQLVPVAKEVSDATRKSAGPNQTGEHFSARIEVRNSPVFKPSLQFLRDQAKTSIIHGITDLLRPSQRHLNITEEPTDSKSRAQTIDSNRPNAAA
jgi:hypothetical protein